MKLSTRGRYGTRLMIELAKNYGDGPMSMSEISNKQGIPVKYLEQLIIPLKKEGLIKSVRGPKGGHMLARDPRKINLWELLSALETSMTFVDCVNDKKLCDEAGDCLIRPVWGKAYQAMMSLFQETSLHDIVNMNENPIELS